MAYNLEAERKIWRQLESKSDIEATIWLDNMYCDACYGCEDHPHICHHTILHRDWIVAEQEDMMRLTHHMADGEIRKLSTGKYMQLTIGKNHAGGRCRNYEYVDGPVGAQ